MPLEIQPSTKFVSFKESESESDREERTPKAKRATKHKRLQSRDFAPLYPRTYELKVLRDFAHKKTKHLSFDCSLALKGKERVIERVAVALWSCTSLTTERGQREGNERERQRDERLVVNVAVTLSLGDL